MLESILKVLFSCEFHAKIETANLHNWKILTVYNYKNIAVESPTIDFHVFVHSVFLFCMIWSKSILNLVNFKLTVI